MKFQIKKDGLTGDTLKFAEVMEGALATAFDEATKGVLTESEVDKLISKALEGKGLTTEQETSIKETAEAVRKQASEIDKIKSVGINATEETLISKLEAAKDELKADKRAGSGYKQFNLNGLSLKTQGVTGVGVIGSETDASIVSTISGARVGGNGPISTINRPAPFILNYISLGNTDSPVLIWFDEVPKEGDFAVTAEGALKPLVQYKFVRRSADYKKAAGYSVLTDEFDRDFPQLVTLIKRLMQIDLKNKINDIVLTDLLAAASTFTYTGLNTAIDNADNYAAIMAAVTQVQTLYFTPNVLFINPTDYAKMTFVKSTTGEYIEPPMNWDGQTYAFGDIVIDPRVTAGSFLLGDAKMYNVDLYSDVIVKIGYVNDDMIRNQYSVLVEQFFYSYQMANKKPALVKGVFNTIKTALETP
jgi:hypothetical protein